MTHLGETFFLEGGAVKFSPYLTHVRKVLLFIFGMIVPDVYNYRCVWLQQGLL